MRGRGPLSLKLPSQAQDLAARMFFQAQDQLLILEQRQERHATIAVERHAIVLAEELVEETIAGMRGQIFPSGLVQEDLHQRGQ